MRTLAIQETSGNEAPHPWQIHRLGFMRDAPLAPSKVPSSSDSVSDVSRSTVTAAVSPAEEAAAVRARTGGPPGPDGRPRCPEPWAPSPPPPGA